MTTDTTLIDPPPLLNPTQAAAHYGVSRQTIYAWLRAGLVAVTIDPATGRQGIDPRQARPELRRGPKPKWV